MLLDTPLVGTFGQLSAPDRTGARRRHTALCLWSVAKPSGGPLNAHGSPEAGSRAKAYTHESDINDLNNWGLPVCTVQDFQRVAPPTVKDTTSLQRKLADSVTSVMSPRESP